MGSPALARLPSLSPCLINTSRRNSISPLSIKIARQMDDTEMRSSDTTSAERGHHLLDVGRTLSLVHDSPARESRWAATMVPDFTWDRHGKYGTASEFARRLAVSGMDVCRFDAEGSGLAGACGRWPLVPWEAMAEEVCAVADWVAGRTAANARKVLIAVGIGGVPAVSAAARMRREGHRGAPEALVLIGADLVQSVRFVVTGMASVRAGEQLAPSRVFRSRERLEPRTELAALDIPVLCVRGAADPRFADPGADLTRFGAVTCVIQNCSDPFEEAVTTRDAASAIQRWIDDPQRSKSSTVLT
ncbi:hypothetical protein OG455_28180 [Kitasatospora sp. NBC_01287]|uniref:alpha/beta hydrolase n=1 Tax=Kitasatospora sp. NBC_01287 TaxID=2903573 RepID=UPI00225669F3|nr:hypothetical protein [Kitasatospora sp. NBC_01287]MCX4749340.1 hypothetical protein [Kitasatospora sp. NBC_01287]